MGPAPINNPTPSIQPTPPSAPAQFPHISPCQSTPPLAPKVTETPKKEASKPIESYFGKSPPIHGNVMEPIASSETLNAGGTDTTPTRQLTTQNIPENAFGPGKIPTTQTEDGSGIGGLEDDQNPDD